MRRSLKKGGSWYSLDTAGIKRAVGNISSNISNSISKRFKSTRKKEDISRLPEDLESDQVFELKPIKNNEKEWQEFLKKHKNRENVDENGAKKIFESYKENENRIDSNIKKYQEEEKHYENLMNEAYYKLNNAKNEKVENDKLLENSISLLSNTIGGKKSRRRKSRRFRGG